MSRCRIVAFSGNLKRPSRTRALVEAVGAALAHQRADLASTTFSTPGPASARPTPDPTSPLPAARIVDAIETADALIVGSPVYKGAYTGLFKHLFDFVEPEALAGKPVILDRDRRRPAPRADRGALASPAVRLLHRAQRADRRLRQRRRLPRRRARRGRRQRAGGERRAPAREPSRPSRRAPAFAPAGAASPPQPSGDPTDDHPTHSSSPAPRRRRRPRPSRPRAAVPREFRIGYQKNGILVVAKQQRAIENRLKPLGIEVKWIEFSFGPPLLEALEHRLHRLRHHRRRAADLRPGRRTRTSSTSRPSPRRAPAPRSSCPRARRSKASPISRASGSPSPRRPARTTSRSRRSRRRG